MDIRTKPTLATLLIAVTLLINAGCSQPHDDVADLVAQAEDAERAGDLRAATVFYGTAATQAPQDGLVRWQLAKALLAMRDGAAAEREILAASRLGMDDDRVRPALAQALLLQQRHSQVTALTLDGLGKTSASIVLAYQARAFTELQDFDQAEHVLRQADAISPYAADVFYARAALALARNDWQATDQALRNVEMVDPDFVYTPAAYGELARRQGDLVSAELWFTKAMQRGHDYWHDRLRRGQVRLAQDNLDGALTDVHALLDADAANPPVLLFAYRVFALRGELAAAADAVRKMIAADPTDLEARYLLARIDLAQHRRDAAAAVLRAILDSEPEHAAARKLLAAMLLEDDRPAQAENLLESFATAEQQDVEALRLLASARLQQQKFDTAEQLLMLLAAYLSGDQQRILTSSLDDFTRSPTAALADRIIGAIALRAVDVRESGPHEVFLVSDPARPSGETNTDDLLAQAHARFEQGDESAAIGLLEQILAEHPTHYAALDALSALALLRDGRPDAMTYLTAALERSPDELAVVELLADYAQARGDSETYRGTLQKALGIAPGRDDLRARLAMHYLDRDKDAHAALALLQGHSVEGSLELRAALAETYYRLNRIPEAIETFNALRSRAPSYAPAYLRLAALYELLRNPGAMQTVLEQLLAASPYDDFAVLAQARLAAIQGNIADASRLLDSSQLGDDEPERLRARCSLALAAGQAEQATALARRLWQAEGSPAALLNLTRTLSLFDQREPAIELLRDWVERHPDDVRALDDLAALYAASDRTEDKLDILTRIVEVAPDRAMALNNLAWALRDTDPAMAEEYARRAAALRPESSQIIDTLVVVLAKNRRFEDAIRYASQAIDSAEKAAPSLLRRAEIFLMAGEIDNALGDLRAIHPGEIPLRDRERRMHLLYALQN